MCVAIYKPQNVQIPSLATLEKCWIANPDGAGFAMLSGDQKYAIEIHKGYMTWKNFVTAFEKYRLAEFTGELFLHFRIATHGGISPGNTHPFSFTQDVKLLQHTNVLSNYALIHNGILPIRPELKGISDTMELCRRLAQNGLYQNIPAIFNLIQGMAGDNKIAVMTAEKVHLFGDWENIDGVFFSNTLWDWRGFERDLCFMSPTTKELRKLNKGLCPYCDGIVERDYEMFYCFDCGETWQEADSTDIDFFETIGDKQHESHLH